MNSRPRNMVVYWDAPAATLVPPDPDQPRVVNGSQVFVGDFGRALLEWSAASRIVVPKAPGPDVGALPTELRSYEGRLVEACPSTLPDLCHGHATVLVSPGPLLLRLASLRHALFDVMVPVTGPMHSLRPRELFGEVVSRMSRLIQPCDAIVCSSLALQKAVRHVYDSLPPWLREPDGGTPTTPVIPYGTSMPDRGAVERPAARERLALPAGRCVILHCGRLSAESKADLVPLLLACSRVARSDDIHLVLMGADPGLRASHVIKEAVRVCGMTDRCTLLANASEAQKRDALAAGDIFVSISENVQESFGIALIEAMAAGLPVVASDWSGYRELVADGHTGLLVPTCWVNGAARRVDGMGDLAAAAATARLTAVDLGKLESSLVTLVRNAELRQCLGEAGSARVRSEFCWPSVVAQYDALWRDLSERATQLRRPPLESPAHEVKQVFSHYPSKTLEQTERIRRRMDCIPEDWMTLMAKDTCRESELEQVLSLIARGKTSRIGDVLEQAELTATKGPQLIARLLKYGVIELA